MKRLLPILLFVLTAAASGQQSGSKHRAEYEKEPNGPHGECPAEWVQIEAGIDYHAIRCLGDPDDLDVHVVRIDPDLWQLETAVVRGSTARDVAAAHRSPFALNANFFGKVREPLGLVMREGKVVNPVRGTDWQSIFLVKDDGGPRIILPDDWSSYRTRAAVAVQAGPRLVVKGKRADIRNNYSAARAGVCIRPGGELLFFATPQERKLSMFEIGRVVRREEVDGGLACRDAMLFDGGHSVNLHLEGGGRTVDVRGDPVPVLLYAVPR